MRYHIKGTKGRLKDVKSEHCQKSRKKGPVHNIEEMVILFLESLAFLDNVRSCARGVQIRLNTRVFAAYLLHDSYCS